MLQPLSLPRFSSFSVSPPSTATRTSLINDRKVGQRRWWLECNGAQILPSLPKNCFCNGSLQGNAQYAPPTTLEPQGCSSADPRMQTSGVFSRQCRNQGHALLTPAPIHFAAQTIQSSQTCVSNLMVVVGIVSGRVLQQSSSLVACTTTGYARTCVWAQHCCITE